MHKSAVGSSFRDYSQICLDRVGDQMDFIDWKMDQAERARSDHFNDVLAKRLDDVGINPYRNDVKISLVGLRSGRAREVQSFRNIKFLPAVAKRLRRGHLEHLEYSTSKNKNRTRMFVLNLGERTHYAETRGRIQDLGRKVSRFACEMRNEWKVDMVFRSTELGKMKRYGAFCQGSATYHVHAHVLVDVPYLGSRERFSEFLEWANKRWREMNNLSGDQSWSVFKDAGVIRDAREACKYMVKAESILALRDYELKTLYHQTAGLHMVKRLGRLRDEHKIMKDQGTRPVRVGKDQWKVIKNWNAHSEAKKRAIQESRANRLISGHSDPVKNVVLALTLPSFQFAHDVCEPCALVNHFGGNESSLRDSCAEVQFLDEVLQRGLGCPPLAEGPHFPLPPYKVHNDTETVLRKGEKQKQGRDPPKILATIP